VRVLLCVIMSVYVCKCLRSAKASTHHPEMNQSSCFERFILDPPDESAACPKLMQ